MQEVEDQDDLKPMLRSKAMTYPVLTKQKWTKEEEDLINVDAKVTLKVAFEMYKKSCHEKEIPVHTYKAFSLKRWRLMAN